MNEMSLRMVFKRLVKLAGGLLTVPLLVGAQVATAFSTELSFESHLSIATMHEKARLSHLHNALIKNPDYASLNGRLKELGLITSSSLLATFFESSVDEEDLSYSIVSCDNPIPHCVDIVGEFSLNHYRVSFYSDRLLRENDLIAKMVEAINYQETITSALRKGPIIKHEDIEHAANQLVSTRAYFYQMMHENGVMGLSGIVSAPESLSLALFNAKTVSKMSSYFSDAFASLNTYLNTTIGETKVLKVSKDNVDVSIEVATSISNEGQERLKRAFASAFDGGQSVNMMGDGEAKFYPESSSVAVFQNDKSDLRLCLARLPDVNASLPADHVKLFNLIKRSEMRMDYNIGNNVVDVPFITGEAHSVQVRIPYEDKTRTRRIRTIELDCDKSLSISTQTNTSARVNVTKAELSSIRWTGKLYSNL
ncbi:hypothetical protein [Alteromonas gracilis]|uniref:hypothetical protein n=1 Tax=Alteromonas gracilis TaxID=1479524 RepID=UPI00373634A7